MKRGGARRDEAPGEPWIEHTHQREVIKTADWMLDLGPEGGDKGGEIVAEGTLEQVVEIPGSYTGGYLKPLLNAPRAEAVTPKPRKKRASTAVREREAAE